MAYSFHKMNKDILSFDCKNEGNKIILNHYIMKKVNFNKMNGSLPKGYFEITSRSAAKDLNLSKSTISRMMDEFVNIGVIDIVKKSTLGRGSSIYKYITEREGKIMQTNAPLNEPIYKTVDGTFKISDFKDLSSINYPKEKTLKDSKHGTSKRENIKKELNNIYTRVIDYLNNKSNKRFKSNTKKTKTVINARLDEGFVEEDFYKVIDIKCSQWLNSEMEKFIRPETLFSSKFEGYLNEKSIVNDEKLEEIEPYEINFNY